MKNIIHHNKGNWFKNKNESHEHITIQDIDIILMSQMIK